MAAHSQTDIPAVCQRRTKKAAALVTLSVPYSVKCGLNLLSSPTNLEYEVCRGGEGMGRHVTKIRQ